MHILLSFFYKYFLKILLQTYCKWEKSFYTKENLKKIGKLKKWEEIWEVFKSCTLPLVVVFENARTILYFAVAVL